MDRIDRIGGAGRATQFGARPRAWCYICHHEHLREEAHVRFNERRVDPSLRPCAHCGKPFKPGGGRKVYCTVGCWSEARYDKRVAKARAEREAVTA